jgi:hypothetical protein
VSLDFLRDRPSDNGIMRRKRQRACAIVDELRTRDATDEWIDTATLDPELLASSADEHKAPLVVYRKPPFDRRGLSLHIAELAELRYELERQRRIARKGGKNSTQKRQEKNAKRDADIIAEVERMLHDDPDEKHQIAGKLAIKNKLTPNQIRNIAPILKKAKTKPA